ncbi:hypothetical protein BT63DRAFT_374874, partial [Microthyrium microscopicum]
MLLTTYLAAALSIQRAAALVISDPNIWDNRIPDASHIWRQTQSKSKDATDRSDQTPDGRIELKPTVSAIKPSTRKLTGKFLQITDIHPDPYYKTYANTDEESACHRGKGVSGYYGAETSDCDTPLSLVNATFAWLKENLRDEVDFIIWTGDSARHDNDEDMPRSRKQVISQNEFVVSKFLEAFGKPENWHDDDPTNDFLIPVIPTLGNNDILPHNVMTAGPNSWTTSYLKTWRQFIPEEQRHQFQRGGWFSSEVIPNQLAVFSLNTLYFFTSNAATDGCAAKSEPGFEQFEWLRAQLNIVRARGMKAILMGHVPPARVESKVSWDETCWQKYTLWTHQFRDVIVAGLYGHMNIDHFLLQDWNDVKKHIRNGKAKINEQTVIGLADDDSDPSLVPNYFPTVRVYSYNISG